MINNSPNLCPQWRVQIWLVTAHVHDHIDDALYDWQQPKTMTTVTMPYIVTAQNHDHSDDTLYG